MIDERKIARWITDAVVRRPALWGLFRGRMRDMFDRIAPTWEARIGPHHLGALHLAVDGPTPARVLDIGTGTGVAAHALAEWFPSSDVVGVDLAAAMIDEARRKGGRARFEVADASHLPFPDASFDLVVLMNAVPFFEEISRVLAPGGYAVFSFSRGSETPIYVPNDRLRRGLARRGFADFAEFEADPASAFRARKR
ncbi:MAG TPA: class I SAM-dependent methyltransferase [Candidatus Limnocylindria bacterium]|nr:class I SAM-dependent methyltransferase [Candidatus Limnocylindria bacterium]